jgi:hypothetical protein
MLITFGKHTGKEIDDVPSSYLDWIVNNHDDDELVTAAEEELQYRNTHHCHIED